MLTTLASSLVLRERWNLRVKFNLSHVIFVFPGKGNYWSNLRLWNYIYVSRINREKVIRVPSEVWAPQTNWVSSFVPQKGWVTHLLCRLDKITKTTAVRRFEQQLTSFSDYICILLPETLGLSAKPKTSATNFLEALTFVKKGSCKVLLELPTKWLRALASSCFSSALKPSPRRTLKETMFLVLSS